MLCNQLLSLEPVVMYGCFRRFVDPVWVMYDDL